MKKILFFSFLILMSIFISCSEDDPVVIDHDNNGSNFSALQMTEDVALCISYDMTVSTFIAPLDTDDKSEMTHAEQTQAIPKPMGCRVKQMVKKNGKIDADIEMIQFEGLPKFPDRMIGNQKFPEKFNTKRIEIRDGISTHYNSLGEVIAEKYQSERDEILIRQLMDDISENTRLSSEHMDILIQGFKDAGFDLKTDTRFNNIEIMTVQNSDQSTTKLYLDKELQLIRGRDNLDTNGKLSSSSHFIYSDNGEMTGHWFASYYTSPFSNNAMAINKISKLDNLSIQLNQ